LIQVKYWALGNEVWGPWQVEQMSKEAYAAKAIQWAKGAVFLAERDHGTANLADLLALKLLDPSITLILCGQDGTSSWDYYTLKQCIQPNNSPLSHSAHTLIDMHSIHMYTASENHLANVTAPLAAERAIEITSALIDLARIENGVPPSQPRPTICFDEWNVWDPKRAVGSEGAEEKYTLSDALAAAVWLNVFVRQSREVGMACIAQSVNVISPLMTTKDAAVKQTTWWPLWLFARYMRGWTVGVHVSAGIYEGQTAPAWLRGGTREISWLDVSACVDEESGRACLAVVNIHEEKDFETEVEGIADEVEVYTVTGENVKVTNVEPDGQHQNVGVRESSWDGRGRYTFPRHSFTLLRWKV
jgi:alpha-N-arabinofuranosidase